MDSYPQVDINPESSYKTPDYTRNSSFQRSISSIQSAHSRTSHSHSIREVSFSSEPVSNPVRYKENSDVDARLVYVNDPERTNHKFVFAGNLIRTSKYSVLTFLPRNLFEQFHRVAYIYFLVIGILNRLPQLAVFGRGASIMPLAFVLLVTAVKDGYEDFRRHRSDRIENNRMTWVLVDDKFQQKKWKDIRVGEIIKVSGNETLPCDMVLLSTSDPTGVAYVQTTNLDGESNLKTRYAKQETHMKNPLDERISGLIKCEKPNRNIYGFQANMDIDRKRISLGPSNIILRGCELKNTQWAIGVVVYAGRETKAMLNNSGATSKRSRLETLMNREIIFLSIFLVTLCTIVCICHGVWLRRHKDELDMMQFYRRRDYSEAEVENYEYYGWGLEILFVFLMSVIVFQIMIPISLYISMELVRVGQAYFMIRDKRMFDESSKSGFQCRSLNINEDLGQIKYVFSDKTGTLTENKMEFQCASIAGKDYSNGKVSTEDDQTIHTVQADGTILKPKMMVKVDPELVDMSRTHANEGRYGYDFFVALAACNTIVPLTVETSDPAVKLIEYQGESPDEQALVYAAAAYGFMLVERTSGHIVIDIQGERQRFTMPVYRDDPPWGCFYALMDLPDEPILYIPGAEPYFRGHAMPFPVTLETVEGRRYPMDIIRVPSELDYDPRTYLCFANGWKYYAQCEDIRNDYYLYFERDDFRTFNVKVYTANDIARPPQHRFSIKIKKTHVERALLPIPMQFWNAHIEGQFPEIHIAVLMLKGETYSMSIDRTHGKRRLKDGDMRQFFQENGIVEDSEWVFTLILFRYPRFRVVQIC